MEKVNIKNLTVDEMTEKFSELGLESYRVTQVRKWLYQKLVLSFEEMTDIRKEHRLLLEEYFFIPSLILHGFQQSGDGTRKYLMGLEDERTVECVWIPEPKRATLCVSSQVCCGMGCGFCLTATMGVLRNLKVYEITEQIAAVKRSLKEGEKITNLVFMGMGEPLANTRNLFPALNILLDPLGFGFSRHHITVSTSGIAPEIEKFGNNTPVKLAISLNATTDKVRDEIMPINQKFPLEKLFEACRKMHLPKRNKITFEYVMLHGINDTLEDAKRLVKILSKLKAKLNLIPFNEYPGTSFKRPADEWVHQFQKVLLNAGFVVNVRKSRGRDILGACGQLAKKGWDREQ